jgi:glycosyltransferase involved in cell wall biosynthesis
LAQTFKNYELIIIDDGSTDRTDDLLIPLINLGKIKYLKSENRGVSFARNWGAKNAVGKFIAFLDSDDEWFPYKLQRQVDYLNQNPHLKIVYGEEIWMRKDRRVNQKAIHKKSGGWILSKCVQQCLIAPSSVMLEKKLFDEVGGFDESFVVCEDYDLWLRISSLVEVGFIADPLIIKYGGHNDQLSMKYPAMDFWRLLSSFWILKNRKLDAGDKLIVIESIKRRGNILMLGHQKYGNTKDYQLVDEMLQELDTL